MKTPTPDPWVVQPVQRPAPHLEISNGSRLVDPSHWDPNQAVSFLANAGLLLHLPPRINP